MHITFLGTGTSQGIPVITCNCNVCKSHDLKDTRLRSSLFFSVNGVDFTIDAGPDFRQQMLANSISNVDAILVTHEHKDHLAGLDDIRPYNFHKKQAIDVFAEQRVIEAIKQEYSYVFSEQKYPGVPVMNVHEVTNTKFAYKSIEIQPIRVLHWNLPIFGYKIGTFAYISDASEISENELEKLYNLDVLVLNALRIPKHYSHFNLDEALAVIRKVNPKRAYLTHISHLMGLHSEVQQQLPENVYLAYDGLQIEI